MSSHDNARTLQRGFSQFEKARERYIEKTLIEVGTEILTLVAKHRQFTGFTGNTQTSYACGIYVNGNCTQVIRQTNWNEPPKRVKVPAGRFVYLKDPYEGEARGVKGKRNIPNDGGFGADTSVRFLLTYKGAPKRGWGMVVCTGTEYSEYLETVKHLDVLSGTAAEVTADWFESRFRPMPAEWQ